MQTHGHDAAGDPTPPLPQAGAGEDATTFVLPPDEMSHDREQIRLLLVGFATGLLIGGLFLVYIVFATANYLP